MRESELSETEDFTTTLQAALAPGYTLERELSGGG